MCELVGAMIVTPGDAYTILSDFVGAFKKLLD